MAFLHNHGIPEWSILSLYFILHPHLETKLLLVMRESFKPPPSPHSVPPPKIFRILGEHTLKKYLFTVSVLPPSM